MARPPEKSVEEILAIADGLTAFAVQCVDVAKIAGDEKANVTVLGAYFREEAEALARALASTTQGLSLLENVMRGAFYLGTHIGNSSILENIKKSDALDRAAKMRAKKASVRPSPETRNGAILKHALIFTKGKAPLRKNAKAIADKITASVCDELGAKYKAATIATYLQKMID